MGCSSQISPVGFGTFVAVQIFGHSHETKSSEFPRVHTQPWLFQGDHVSQTAKFGGQASRTKQAMPQTRTEKPLSDTRSSVARLQVSSTMHQFVLTVSLLLK